MDMSSNYDGDTRQSTCYAATTERQQTITGENSMISNQQGNSLLIVPLVVESKFTH